jgi:hypothetical protein
MMKNTVLVQLLGFLVICIAAVIFFLSFGIQEQQEARAEKSGREIIVYNDGMQPAECLVSYEGISSSYSIQTGIIVAGGQSTVQAWGPVGAFDVECVWADYDSQCQGTTPVLCSMAKSDARLRGCLAYEVPYQYFCAAMITSNSTLCGSILFGPRRHLCLAFLYDKPSECFQLTQYRDWCLEDYAVNEGQLEVCSFIADKGKQAYCRALVENDVDYCLGLDNKDDCIVRFARYKENPGLCERADNKEACYAEMEY